MRENKIVLNQLPITMQQVAWQKSKSCILIHVLKNHKVAAFKWFYITPNLLQYLDQQSLLTMGHEIIGF